LTFGFLFRIFVTRIYRIFDGWAGLILLAARASAH
jgi:hypothetical protein